LRNMVRRLLAAGVVEVGIERPDGPVVDALLAAGLTVFVIPPGQLKNLRSRYGSAGNKDDRFDAFVLADTVRTDRRRLQPLLRDEGYCGRTDPAVLHARIVGAPRGVAGDTHVATTQAFVAVLRTLTAQIEILAARIAEQLALHPDQAIFTSLPRSGTVRAARL